MRYLLAGFAVVVIVGCAPRVIAPAPAPARSATGVSASLGETWDAVIDVFTQQHIPIRNIERVSGLIVAEVARIPTGSEAEIAYAASLADCGRVAGGLFSRGYTRLPGAATYNVVVRGDSTRATVLASIRFVHAVHVPRSPTYESVLCETRGRWEDELEQRVKGLAETKANAGR